MSSRMPSRPLQTKKAKSRGTAKAIKLTVAAVAACVGFYFGFVLVTRWQKSFNETGDEAAQNSDGGQVGHIADLYSVLEATDPNRHEDPREPTRRNRAMERADEVAAAPEKELPVIPAVWTLESATAKIPEGRVNGMIAGTNFVMDVARLERQGQSYVLTLRQGTSPTADREILIYLRLGANESPMGFSQMISSDMKGPKVPQVVKRWKPNPKYAGQQKKGYTTGYVMKLELGKLEEDAIPGKIYVALPDTEQTVAAGIFKIQIASPLVGLDIPGDAF
jgi:hypothetical protein